MPPLSLCSYILFLAGPAGSSKHQGECYLVSTPRFACMVKSALDAQTIGDVYRFIGNHPILRTKKKNRTSKPSTLASLGSSHAFSCASETHKVHAIVFSAWVSDGLGKRKALTRNTCSRAFPHVEGNGSEFVGCPAFRARRPPP